MEVWSFILLKDSRLLELRSSIAEIAEKWAEEWCGGMDLPVVGCMRAWELKRQPDSWSRCHECDGKTAWFAFDEDFPRELQHHLFGMDQRHAGQHSGKPALAHQAVLATVDALIGNIAKAFGLPKECVRNPDETSSPDEVFRRGSGAVAIDVSIGKSSLLCLLNDECVRTPERRIPQSDGEGLPGVDLRKKLSDTPLSLHVEVGQAELDIGGLLTLQIGDVIRLSSEIDQPLAITIPEGPKVLGGYLGKQDGNMAIEVVGLKQ